MQTLQHSITSQLHNLKRTPSVINVNHITFSQNKSHTGLGFDWNIYFGYEKLHMKSPACTFLLLTWLSIEGAAGVLAYIRCITDSQKVNKLIRHLCHE